MQRRKTCRAYAGYMRLGLLNRGKGWLLGVMIRQLVEQDNVEQRLMYLDSAVVTYKSQLAKAIHKEADAGPGGADHLRQCFLSDGWNKGFRFTRFAELGHQQQNPRQTLFTGIEELIDKIGLGS